MFSIVVVSDRVFKGEAEDESGKLMKGLLESKGFKVDYIFTVPNDPKEILRVLRKSNSKAFIFIGGTGPSPRDITLDTLEEVAWRKIPGFGEAFRMKSFEKVGAAGLISRSEMFLLYDGRVSVVIPGSLDAVKTGFELIAGIVPHLLEEAERFEGEHKKPNVSNK
ncbi:MULTISPECIES: MogA/MoaB family molybdenum cofactor biosynthesis protein [Fervidicoccus]|uniref:Molybdenum cofactor synthesis domain protein n=2 Tax=Fervidicoccus fontis TaxID=683846 RepID=H9ZZM5_FERFK|nr:MogA/MoaB family molybdenum cofactor biosynthesis protein [Fervidicoccus fontis]AFH42182.1 molybdenum cofactor synthesis domain protein [Fervidicoccus fontis Kam940]PMB76011.1 MAG: bifunctional molybdenum cofactor biosynthesis protein MoaC/MoaB [Fervidicoccus fontis]PMB77135.1 MAG: bifunctional molybdenum cofactor biosynthesis protein MoaC/MoaB [Fervidicoccus fontis]HEW64319.1 MogA/MoaB family molybdenum cofactor biosynthesis protein [Fervidicoccus fontis]